MKKLRLILSGNIDGLSGLPLEGEAEVITMLAKSLDQVPIQDIAEP